MNEIRRFIVHPIRSVFIIAIVGLFVLAPIVEAQHDPSLYSGLHWRMVGPFRAGRVNAVSGVAGQPDTFYFGSVGGGVWKSMNSGRTWTPVFDANNVASIGAIGVASSNPDVVYVGTGEADMRDSIQFGDGIYKSIDARESARLGTLENAPAVVYTAVTATLAIGSTGGAVGSTGRRRDRRRCDDRTDQGHGHCRRNPQAFHQNPPRHPFHSCGSYKWLLQKTRFS